MYNKKTECKDLYIYNIICCVKFVCAFIFVYTQIDDAKEEEKEPQPQLMRTPAANTSLRSFSQPPATHSRTRKRRNPSPSTLQSTLNDSPNPSIVSRRGSYTPSKTNILIPQNQPSAKRHRVDDNNHNSKTTNINQFQTVSNMYIYS